MLLILVMGGVILVSGIFWFFRPLMIVRNKKKEENDQINIEQDYKDPITKKLVKFTRIIDQPSCYLTVVVPAFNEELRIGKMLKETFKYLEERQKNDCKFTYEVIVVDDGSTDHTVAVVEELSFSKIKVLRLLKNHGKGGAVRKGMLCASGRYLLMVDADGATNIEDFSKLEKEISKSHNSLGTIACGSRAHLEEEAISKRNPIRNILMHGFHFIVSTLCVKSIRDTQCGFKLFDRRAAQLVFPPMHIERWAFDVEILYIAQELGLCLQEISVQWKEVPGSKLNVFSATVSMFREICLIRLCYVLGIWKTTDGGFRIQS